MVNDKLESAHLSNFLDYNTETGVFRWKVAVGKKIKPGDIAGTSCKAAGRLFIGFEGGRYRAHRLAWLLTYGKFPEGLIDHIDGNPLNNKLNNLRDVTATVNQQNRRSSSSSNKSGYLGVDYHNYNKKYRATVTLDGKQKHVGYFSTPEAAYEAYLAAKRILHEGCTI